MDKNNYNHDFFYIRTYVQKEIFQNTNEDIDQKKLDHFSPLMK